MPGFRPSLGSAAGLPGTLPTFRACRRAGHSASAADVRRASGRLPPGNVGLAAGLPDVRRATSGFRPSLGKRKQTGKGFTLPVRIALQTAP